MIRNEAQFCQNKKPDPISHASERRNSKEETFEMSCSQSPMIL